MPFPLLNIDKIPIDNEIRYDNIKHSYFIWKACEDCGKFRWVAYHKTGKIAALCMDCLGKSKIKTHNIKNNIPEINEIRYGREINNTDGIIYSKTTSYIYKECMECKIPRWVRLDSSNKSESLLCRSCYYKNLQKYRADHSNKTIISSEPYIGEIRTGIQIGKNNNDNYIWQPCSSCLNSRWTPYRNGKAEHAKCEKCATILFKELENKNEIKDPNHIYYKHEYKIIKIDSTDKFYSMGMDSRGKIRYVFEHRYIMAKFLDRILTEDEWVHHKNGIKDDNRIENLELTYAGKHTKDHNKGYQDGYNKGINDKILQLESEVISLNNLIKQSSENKSKELTI